MLMIVRTTGFRAPGRGGNGYVPVSEPQGRGGISRHGGYTGKRNSAIKAENEQLLVRRQMLDWKSRGKKRETLFSVGLERTKAYVVGGGSAETTTLRTGGPICKGIPVVRI